MLLNFPSVPNRTRTGWTVTLVGYHMVIRACPVHCISADAGSRSTVRIVSGLTPNSAAKSRKVRLLPIARIVALSDGVSFDCRGDWGHARRDFPLTRRGGTTAISIGSVP